MTDKTETPSIATFRKRADNWEANEGELGKIVASEIRGVVDEFERELTQANEQARLGWERHAEKDAAYQKALNERDQWREVAGRLAKCHQEIWDADEMGYLLDGRTEECVQCGSKRAVGSVRQIIHTEECVQGWIENALAAYNPLAQTFGRR